jgi:hypothetical protein
LSATSPPTTHLLHHRFRPLKAHGKDQLLRIARRAVRERPPQQSAKTRLPSDDEPICVLDLRQRWPELGTSSRSRSTPTRSRRKGRPARREREVSQLVAGGDDDLDVLRMNRDALTVLRRRLWAVQDRQELRTPDCAIRVSFERPSVP